MPPRGRGGLLSRSFCPWCETPLMSTYLTPAELEQAHARICGDEVAYD